MTYLTAICDDEKAELKKTEKILTAYEREHSGVHFVVECFGNVEDLLCRIGDRTYAPDLVIMDIFMPGKEGKMASCGMEAAKRLRDMGSRAKLFFLTTSKEYALDAFDVDASQYLLKPVTQERLFYALERFVEKEEEERKSCLLLKVEGRIVKVAVNDIVYCEAQGKTQHLHLTDDEECRQRMTMSELNELLSPYCKFVRIGAAFIVNLEHINSLNSQEIYLTGGKKIYLPRGAYKGLREQYFNYYCKAF